MTNKKRHLYLKFVIYKSDNDKSWHNHTLAKEDSK